MKRKDLLKEIGYKLKKARRALKYSAGFMISSLQLVPSSYYRNENGKTCPDIMSLQILGREFGISLDWLVCDKGPMFYKEKDREESQEEIPEAAEKEPLQDPLDTLPDEIKELVKHMERIPLLRYEILASFHRFKGEYKETVSEAMTPGTVPPRSSPAGRHSTI